MDLASCRARRLPEPRVWLTVVATSRQLSMNSRTMGNSVTCMLRFEERVCRRRHASRRLQSVCGGHARCSQFAGFGVAPFLEFVPRSAVHVKPSEKSYVVVCCTALLDTTPTLRRIFKPCFVQPIEYCLFPSVHPGRHGRGRRMDSEREVG